MTTTPEAERLLDLCLMTAYAARSATAVQRAPCYTALLDELRRLAAEEDGLTTTVIRQGEILRDVVVAVRGLPPNGKGWSSHDAAELVRALKAEAERTARNRDMWKGQCERQAAELEALRRGEFICGKCGLRKDAETSGPAPF